MKTDKKIEKIIDKYILKHLKKSSETIEPFEPEWIKSFLFDFCDEVREEEKNKLRGEQFDLISIELSEEDLQKIREETLMEVLPERRIATQGDEITGPNPEEEIGVDGFNNCLRFIISKAKEKYNLEIE